MLQYIQTCLPDLSPAERRVAAWILAHPRRATGAAVAEVAQAAGTSQPTVVRLCRSLGLEGFRELKIRLAEALSRPASYLHRDVSAGDSTGDAVLKVVDRAIQTLIDLRGVLASLPFERAIRELAAARQIVFAGTGASGVVARDACHKFFRLGIPCATAVDLPTIRQQCAIAAERDVIVVISQGGRQPGVPEACRAARAGGATVFALTAADSPLAAEADLVFDSRLPRDESIYTPMSSRLALLALLDALQVALALQLGEPAEERLQRSKAALLPAAVAD